MRVNISLYEAQRCAGLRQSMSVLVLILLAAPGHAVVPDDLYAAVVTSSGTSQSAMNAAFDKALSQVLVKVTGRAKSGTELRQRLFPNSRELLQQYRRLGDNRIYAAFDPGTIRRALDRAGESVWGDERPLVAIWLAVDAGSGQRYLLSDGSDDNGGRLGQLRAALLTNATQRGLPVVLPLLDARDLGQVSFGDVWGGFTDRLSTASSRYRSDALLIGRSNSMSSSDSGVNWTLAYAGQQSTWQGSIANAPARVADILAQQFATAAGSEGRVRLRVSGINDMNSYGQLKKYLQSIDVVEAADITQVSIDQIDFDLLIRGDANRLERVLQSSRFLSATDKAKSNAVPGPADLSFRWVAGR